MANNGTDLPESALLGSGPTDWACTRDNTSGLLWEVKSGQGLLVLAEVRVKTPKQAAGRPIDARL